MNKEDYTALFEGSQHAKIWQLISVGEFENAKNAIRPFYTQTSDLGWFKKIFKDPKEISSNDLPVNIAYDLLLNRETNKWSYLSNELKNSSGLLPELFRLTVSLRVANIEESIAKEVDLKLLEYLESMAQSIRHQSNDYPANPIKSNIWMDGFNIRLWCDELSKFYCSINKQQGVLRVLLAKANVTCSIMGHYEYEVSSDMVAVGKQLEKLGRNDEAKDFYTPVIADMANTVQIFREYPDQIPDEHDVITLRNLQYAYEAIDRIQNTNENGCSVEEIIQLLNKK